MNDQLSDKLRHELYLEALTNGLNEAEYKKLLQDVNALLDHASITSLEYRTGEHPDDYEEK